MDEKKEGLEPQNPPEEPTVSLSQEELDDLKHRAEVSSQNFERLKKVQEENELLKAQLVDNPVLPELDDPVDSLKSELSEIKQKLQKSEVIESYPILKETWQDFEEFRQLPDNKGMNMKTAAKSFLIEKGLLETPRKGLEKLTGGGHEPISSGMKTEDIKRLRETDYRKYSEMIRKGQLKISEK